ncbi:MAG: SRPBCC family protein [Acidimicrobiia bacterium]
MPSQTFVHTASATVAIDEVWAALDEPGTWESIGRVNRVFDPVVDERGRLRGFSFETVAAGRNYVGTATPGAREEGRRMTWNVDSSEVRGTTTVELEPVAGGTKIQVTLQVESAGLLSSMIFPVIAGAIGSGLGDAVDEFAAGFET